MKAAQSACRSVSCLAGATVAYKQRDHTVHAQEPQPKNLIQEQLVRVSPIDGRYGRATKPCQNYFSEYALHKYRVRVEIEYFIALLEAIPGIDKLTEDQKAGLRRVYTEFSLEDGEKIKATERITNHDVKAVEYFVKEKLDEMGLGDLREYVHFALTSEDINCTAAPLSLKEFIINEYIPMLHKCVLDPLRKLARELEDIPMLAKTHGQPATPTRLGKEIMVFVERVDRQLVLLEQIPFSGKFGGATGGYNAHNIAYPAIDWVKFGNQFYRNAFGMDRQQFTTQIEHYDDTAAMFDGIRRINTILMDFSKDIWQYISMEYFKQRVVANEVGSSAMPHKVNPIDFENAEGNFGIANAVLEHLSNKLPISRLQRDLTDSTVRRNYGVPLAHTLIAFQSLERGIGKLLLNRQAVDNDLNRNWAVTAEAVQTILRREKFDQPYEALKAATRGQEITQQSMARFLSSLNVTMDIMQELRLVTPHSFGKAALFPRQEYESAKQKRMSE